MKQQPLTSSRAAPCRHVTHDLSSCSQLGDQISAHYHLCRWARPQPVRNINNHKNRKSLRRDDGRKPQRCRGRAATVLLGVL